MKKRTKTALTVLLALVLVLGTAAFITVRSMADKLTALDNVDIDMTLAANGVYTGSSDIGIVKAEVKEHRIVNIELVRHLNGRGEPAESALDEMTAHSTDDADAVSGATASSETVKNAVNKALRQGIAE